MLLLAACGADSPADSSGSTTNLTIDDSDPSVARLWNEVLLEAIRGDLARPTIHARNLHHLSAAMYDAWAAYSDEASPYLLGRTIGGFTCHLDAGFVSPVDVHPARVEAISHAAWKLIQHRFRDSPGAGATKSNADNLLMSLGFSVQNESTEYTNGSAAALGNYIADCYIALGLLDGSNEAGGFANEHYVPVNAPIHPYLAGNPDITDLDRWQPISLPVFIDQAGNQVDEQPEFLSPEWGQVAPFALSNADKTSYRREGEEFDYEVFFDPGIPPTANGSLSEHYKWGFSLVAIWSSHLDPNVGRGAQLIDISPRSLGSPSNAHPEYYPAAVDEYSGFYDRLAGGDRSTGYTVNPVTGAEYEAQWVPLGDYARVLAEFWADGPDSETPPGHWFVILNEVSDHPLLEKRIAGGPLVGPLEWDVKAYFAMGGAMHDAAIASWGIKGWYDYLRPLSAIRAMVDIRPEAGRGQSSDPFAPSYSPDGIPLVPGLIELVEPGDVLAGPDGKHVGKIKLFAWRGPRYIGDPGTSVAGVGWILAENWWPYQRPTFVTPPFAGYISGHSTYSRAAAEVMTLLTDDPYFPGGMSGFEVKANEFLVFEDGPSVDMTLEWATYRDASDQCSLSRIWGGIHPPADDMPGRLIGMKIGPAAFKLAEEYFIGRAGVGN